MNEQRTSDKCEEKEPVLLVWIQITNEARKNIPHHKHVT